MDSMSDSPAISHHIPLNNTIPYPTPINGYPYNNNFAQPTFANPTNFPNSSFSSQTNNFPTGFPPSNAYYSNDNVPGDDSMMDWG